MTKAQCRDCCYVYISNKSIRCDINVTPPYPENKASLVNSIFENKRCKWCEEDEGS